MALPGKTIANERRFLMINEPFNMDKSCTYCEYATHNDKTDEMNSYSPETIYFCTKNSRYVCHLNSCEEYSRKNRESVIMAKTTENGVMYICKRCGEQLELYSTRTCEGERFYLCDCGFISKEEIEDDLASGMLISS